MQTFLGVSDLFLNLYVSTLKGFSLNSGLDSFLPIGERLPCIAFDTFIFIPFRISTKQLFATCTFLYYRQTPGSSLSFLYGSYALLEPYLSAVFDCQ